jgi:orotate phosphoribosyltransferase
MYTCVAEALLKTGCVGLSPDAPYTLTSGKTSPVYVDARKILSYPDVRAMVMASLTEKARDLIAHHHINVIAGGETAGIPYAAMLADRLNLPMIYIRKKPKDFGRGRQIEGELPEDARVLLVEDLMSFGSSKKVFLDALSQAGASVPALAVVFSYNLFDWGSALAPHPVPDMASVATWQDVYNFTKNHRSLFSREATFLENLLARPQDFIK